MKLKDDIILIELGDEYAAIPTGDAAEDLRIIIRLNETGAAIWKGLADGKTVEQIARALVEEYEGVDLPQAKDAVLGVIDRLQKEGLLEEGV